MNAFFQFLRNLIFWWLFSIGESECRILRPQVAATTKIEVYKTGFWTIEKTNLSDIFSRKTVILFEIEIKRVHGISPTHAEDVDREAHLERV